MPKKTLEQKIRAQKRRLAGLEKAIPLGQAIDTKDKQQEQITTPVFRLPNLGKIRAYESGGQTIAATAKIQSTDIAYIKRDMIRISLLTVGILGIEFLLYWLLEIKNFSF